MSADLSHLDVSGESQRANYELAFQTSPIILQSGIAVNVQGGLSPITNYTGGPPQTKDDVFATYLPLPGSTLISNAVGMYPFANQQVAANAIIQQPLTLSMHMIAPVNQPGEYLRKLQIFTSLQNSLQQHNSSGGMYIVATPAFVYTNLLMTAMTDITSSDSKQKMIEWQIDFIQPILTLAGAAAAQNNLMNTVTGGQKITGTPGWSGNPGTSPATATGVTAALSAFGGGV